MHDLIRNVLDLCDDDDDDDLHDLLPKKGRGTQLVLSGGVIQAPSVMMHPSVDVIVRVG